MSGKKTGRVVESTRDAADEEFKRGEQDADYAWFGARTAEGVRTFMKSAAEHFFNAAGLYARKKDPMARYAQRRAYSARQMAGEPGAHQATLGNQSRLAKAVASIILFSGGLFFLSPNITGNVIGSMSYSSSNWIGVVLFIIGLISAFVYFKGRK